MADTLQQLLRTRAEDDAVAVKYGDTTVSWRRHIDEAARQAAAVLAVADPDRPLHVAVLMGNSPHMLTALAAAGLGGYVLCGVNTTRRGAALARDIARVDTQILLTDTDHLGLLDGVDLPDVTVFDVTTDQWAQRLAAAPPLTPHREVTGDDTFMMIFTSGTSGEPKAVEVPHSTVPRTPATWRCRCFTPTPCTRAGAWRWALGRRWPRPPSRPRRSCPTSGVTARPT